MFYMYFAYLSLSLSPSIDSIYGDVYAQKTCVSALILVYFALICRGKDPALAWLSLWPRCDVCGKRLAPYKRTAHV